MDWSNLERLETRMREVGTRLAALEEANVALQARNAELERVVDVGKLEVRTLKKANAALTEQVSHATQNGALNKDIQLCLTRVMRKLDELQITL